jgi:diketogulonate reductase-like aldo/keto reductase
MFRHLKSNAQALDIHLSQEQVRFLDNVLPFDYGQPMNQVRDSIRWNRIGS